MGDIVIKSENPCVSIIVPVYNTSKVLLSACLGSISKQTYANFETIVVDDGSNSSIADYCDEYAANDLRFKVIHIKNQGVSNARNVGKENACGEYISFVDSDDTLKKDALSKLLNTAKKTNADITVCSCHHIRTKVKRQQREKIAISNQAEAVKYLTHNVNVFDELEPTAVWGKLYRRSVIWDIFFNEKMTIGEDFVFNYMAICKSNIVVYLNLKLYNYNFVETSLMHSKSYSPKLMESFNELVRFEKCQQNTVYSNDLIVRCGNIAFTIYLKVPVNRVEDLCKIESYIRENRSRILNNKKTTGKVKIASCMSYISFKLVRWVFNLTNRRKGR